MRHKVVRAIRWVLILLIFAGIGLLAIRVYDTHHGPALSSWHRFVPHELKAKELDATDWNQYLVKEASLFDEVRREVTQKLEPNEQVATNRYFEESPVYPPHFSQDFNRSYVLEPAGTPVGAVVLLHGL